MKKERLSEEAKTLLVANSPGVQQIARKLRMIVLQLIPGVSEIVDPGAKLLGYGFAPTYKDIICVIIPGKDYVNLGFPRGAELPDPAGLLRGDGKSARHARVRNLSEAEERELRDLILAAHELWREG
jgi:hypothetical protein